MNELDRILSLIGQKYGTDKAFENDIGIPNRIVSILVPIEQQRPIWCKTSLPQL